MEGYYIVLIDFRVLIYRQWQKIKKNKGCISKIVMYSRNIFALFSTSVPFLYANNINPILYSIFMVYK
jgi:hypothetical protein